METKKDMEEDQGTEINCPIHKDLTMEVYLMTDYSSSTQTTQDWEFVKCADEDCFVTCGIDIIDEYLDAVKNPKKLDVVYCNTEIDMPKCRCGNAIRLSMSRLEKNRGRLYFTCRSSKDTGRCRFFRWADKKPPQRLLK